MILMDQRRGRRNRLLDFVGVLLNCRPSPGLCIVGDESIKIGTGTRATAREADCDWAQCIWDEIGLLSTALTAVL
jgi:hypothetical protein